MMNNNRNYTIVFNNNNTRTKDVLQMAGKNLVNAEEGAPTISDYYNKKFAKKK